MTKQPTVLVTGGAGYVGSHVCKALHRAGMVPVTLDNLSTGHQQAVKWGPLEVGDVRNEVFVAEVMMRHKATAVLHFAAASLVGESASKPYEYYDNNVNGRDCTGRRHAPLRRQPASCSPAPARSMACRSSCRSRRPRRRGRSTSMAAPSWRSRIS